MRAALTSCHVHCCVVLLSLGVRGAQLGGSFPSHVRDAVSLCQHFGYDFDEVNLNCGCPSDKVSGAGCFGAALMLTPKASLSRVRSYRIVSPLCLCMSVPCLSS